MKKSVVFYISEDVATQPASGECIANSWWTVHPEKGLAFWAQLTGYSRSEAPAPQCNVSRSTSEQLCAQLYPGHEVRQIPVVYMVHAAREMRRLRDEAQARALPAPPAVPADGQGA